jgi:hypothetical protein
MTEEPPTPADIAADAALALASAAGAGDFAAAVAKKRAVRGVLATLLAHELGASHRLMMRLAARADSILDRAEAAEDDTRLGQEAVRAVSGVARMMERYRLGILALDRLRGGDKAEKQKKHYVCLYWGDDPPPGQPHINDIRPPRTDPPPPDPPPPDPPPPPPPFAMPPPEPALSPSLEPLAGHRPKGFGSPLRYDNPSGDLRAAPRCGAATRAGGACCQPAMANGRCRLHGGKSTGPRTAAGLARSRAARLVHGHRTAEAIALRAAAAKSNRRLGELIEAERRLLAGQGVHRSNRPCAEPSPGEAETVARPFAGPDSCAPPPGEAGEAHRRSSPERRPAVPAPAGSHGAGKAPAGPPSTQAAADAASGSGYRILRRLFGEGPPPQPRTVAAAVAGDGLPSRALLHQGFERQAPEGPWTKRAKVCPP